jgi:hypothetical protein
MRSIRWLLTSLASAGLLLGLVLLTGCGGGSTPPEEEETKTKDSKKQKDKGLAMGTGSVKGRVTIAQDKMPDTAELNAKLLAFMKSKASAADLPHCLDMAPEDQRGQQEWIISKDKGVKNVFVFLKPAKGTYFAVEEKDPGVQAVKDKPAELDQPHCAFVPHALPVFPSYKNGKGTKVKTGQKLVVKNSAKIAHNTNLQGIKNEIIPSGGALAPLELEPASTPITVQCNIHPWMDAYVWPLDHPYVAITDADGNFEIKNVPAGDVHIVVWHDKAKFISDKGPSGEPITTTSGVTTKEFVIK